MKSLIERFNSINSLKVSLEREIEDTEFQIQEYSNLLGEKIRTNEEFSADDPDFLALKAKLDGPSDKKSKDKKLDNEETTDKELDNEETTDKELDNEETTDKELDDEETTDEKRKTKKIKEKDANAKKKLDKKKKGGKGVSDKWYDLNEILIYNGMGLKGELELYFRAIDELKTKLENHQRTLSTLNNVIEKGLKEDMGCIAFRGTDGTLEITFLKSSGLRQNFVLKSIYSVKAIPVENIIKIGV